MIIFISLFNLAGFQIHNYNIVSVDVNSPSSLIHELTHLIDLSNREFHDTPERRAMVSHFTKKLSLPEELSSNMSKDYIDALFNHKEVIARLEKLPSSKVVLYIFSVGIKYYS